MAKQAGRLRKLLRRVLRFQRPSKGAAGLLRLLRLLRGAQNVPRSSFEAQSKQLVWGFGRELKTCHVAVSKPNRNRLWGLGRYHGKAGGTPSQAAAEGFAIQRPSKAAAGVLRLLKLLRGAQNVPRSSFEAQ